MGGKTVLINPPRVRFWVGKGEPNFPFGIRGVYFCPRGTHGDSLHFHVGLENFSKKLFGKNWAKNHWGKLLKQDETKKFV